MSEDTNLLRKELWDSIDNKGSRDAFVASHLSNNIGAQIFSMREARGWSQGKLAAEVGMAQPRISLLEGGYDKYSLTTLKRIASTFDVAVVVRFVPFSELIDWVVNLSEERLAPVEFANDNLVEVLSDNEIASESEGPFSYDNTGRAVIGFEETKPKSVIMRLREIMASDTQNTSGPRSGIGAIIESTTGSSAPGAIVQGEVSSGQGFSGADAVAIMTDAGITRSLMPPQTSAPKTQILMGA